MKIQKWKLLAVLTLCGCVLLTGCGKKEDTRPPQEEPPVAAESAEEPKVFLGDASWGKNGEYEFNDLTEEGWEEDRARAEELNEASGDKAPGGSFDVEKAQKVVELVNRERAARGLKELKLDKEIEGAAELRAEEQKTLYAHDRPDGTGFYTVFDEFGIVAYVSGENLACSSPCKPEQVVKAWINSPGHAANLFSADYTRIGVGCYTADGYCYWAQLFVG